MFEADKRDIFSLDSWNATFKSLNSWFVEIGKKAGSGMVPLVLGATLATSAPTLAHYKNMAIADAGTRGPPVLSQEVAQFALVSTPQFGTHTQATEFEFNPAVQLGEQDAVLQPPMDEEGNTVYSAAALNAELRKLQSVHRDLAAMVSIDPSTIRVATLISGQIPSPISPSIGFNAGGNVFLHFQNKRIDAYLTIERRAFHLFCKVEGQKNFYLDNEPLLGKRLPSKIRDKFSEMFAA